MIAIIAAMTKNRVIGNKGVIPWRIKGEQLRFKELTTGNTVVMGRRSFEEIGKPLPNRKTILVSSTMNYTADNCITVSSLTEALGAAEGENIYISGGAMLYQEAMPLADVIHLTLIDAEIEGDTYFPDFDETKYEKISEEYHDGELPFTYITYKKIV